MHGHQDDGTHAYAGVGARSSNSDISSSCICGVQTVTKQTCAKLKAKRLAYLAETCGGNGACVKALEQLADGLTQVALHNFSSLGG